MLIMTSMMGMFGAAVGKPLPIKMKAIKILSEYLILPRSPALVNME